MKIKLLLIATSLLFIAACSKDKYDTRPQLKFKDVNKTSFVQGDIIRFDLEFTDKEGDIKDSIWVQRISRICPSTVNIITGHNIPGDFTASKNLKGLFEVSFIYNRIGTPYVNISGCTNRNDTSYFRFWMRDQAGHVSDTISSPEVVFIR